MNLYWPRPWQMPLGFTGFLWSKLRSLVKLIRVAWVNNWIEDPQLNFFQPKLPKETKWLHNLFLTSEKAPPNIYLPNRTNTLNTSKESVELQLGVLQFRNMWGGNEEKSCPIPPRNRSILQVESCIIESCPQDRLEKDVDGRLEMHHLYRIWFRGSGAGLFAQHACVVKCESFMSTASYRK